MNNTILWQKFPFLRFTIAFISGIICLDLFGSDAITLPDIACITGSLLFTYLLLFIFQKRVKVAWMKYILGCNALIALFFLGILVSVFNNQESKTKHISQVDWKYSLVKARIIMPPEEKEKVFKSTVELEAVKGADGWKEVQGKCILYVQKSVQSKILEYGNHVLFKNTLDTIKGPSNPGQFDYKQYLSRKNIYNQAYVQEGDVVVLHSGKGNLLMSVSYKVRNRFSQILAENFKSKRERGIALALVLGMKNDLQNDIKEAYSNVGAMHILAVSGLHVGLLYQIFLFFFKFLKVSKVKFGSLIQAFLLLFVVWSYALITGFSPSVMRASTMFSFIIVGQATSRSSNIYNSIAASAFLLLLLDPNLLFQVSFQLSYLAVLGIVFFQPKIHNWIYVPNKWLNKAWTLTSVSLAAQLVAFPISIYYFGQFPTYFLIANFVAVPSATMILSIGLLKISVGWLDFFNKWITWLYEKIIWSTNMRINLIDGLPFATIKNLHYSILETFLVYGVILLITLLVIRKRQLYFYASFMLFLTLIVVRIEKVFQVENMQSLVIYNVPGYSAIGIQDGRNLSFVNTDSLYYNSSKMNFNIRSHWRESGVRKINNVGWSSFISDIDKEFAFNSGKLSYGDLLVCNGKTILILDKQEIPEEFSNTLIPFDYILVRNNTLLSENISEFISPSRLVFDASCSWWYLDELPEEIRDYAHITSRDGALTL